MKNNTHALPGNKSRSVMISNNESMKDEGCEKEKLFVEPYIPSDPGPYPQNQPKQNSVRFTPTQVSGKLYF